MNTTTLAIGAPALLVVVALMALTPTISRPTVPLGVSVPRAHADDPAVRAAVRRFRVSAVGIGLVALAGLAATSHVPALVAVWILGYVVAASAAFALCRRGIVAAKEQGGWYDGVPVRVAATISGRPPQVRVAWAAQLLALTLGIAGVVTMAVAYPRLPDPFPTHYGADGHADAFAAKSWATVMVAPAIGLGVAVLLLVLAVATARRHDPLLPDGNVDAARAADAQRGRLVQTCLGWTSVVVAASMLAISVADVADLPAGARSVLVAGIVVASLLPVVWVTWRAAQIQREARAAGGGSAESPDDDAHWKAGLFYVNPGDPRAFVPKRTGIGLTVNLAHPVGAAFMGATAVIVVLSVALPLALH